MHGHTDSACAFRVLRGIATESVLGERDRMWAPGSVVAEEEPRVHQVRNQGPDPLLTLHAYSPPLEIDEPSSPQGHSVVILGGGFAGAAVAYHLLRRGGPSLRVHVIERGPWLGRGIAYESKVRPSSQRARVSHEYRPRSRTGFRSVRRRPRCSPILSQSGVVWAVRDDPPCRCDPGESRENAPWRDDAVAVTDREVLLGSGRRLAADAVVLATGLAPRISNAGWHPCVVDAWDECALASLPMSGQLLLLGSGLSALDVLAFLDGRGFEGRVTMVSPRGILSLAHEETLRHTEPLPLNVVREAPRELLPLLRWVREGIESAMKSGMSWQSAMDRLRPHGKLVSQPFAS